MVEKDALRDGDDEADDVGPDCVQGRVFGSRGRERLRAERVEGGAQPVHDAQGDRVVGQVGQARRGEFGFAEVAGRDDDGRHERVFEEVGEQDRRRVFQEDSTFAEKGVAAVVVEFPGLPDRGLFRRRNDPVRRRRVTQQRGCFRRGVVRRRS